MTSVIFCWAHDWKCVWQCVQLQVSTGKGSHTVIKPVSVSWALLSSHSPNICFFFPPALSWHQSRGCRAKWSVSEERHPLGMVQGTNAAAFPLFYPSVGFGPFLWTTTQFWLGMTIFVRQPGHFALDFSLSTVRSISKWEWKQNFCLWTVGWVKHWEKIIPWHSRSHKCYFRPSTGELHWWCHFKNNRAWVRL